MGWAIQFVCLEQLFHFPCQLVSVLAAILSIWLLGRMARRRMLIIAQFGTIIVHVCIGISQLLLPEGTAKGMLVLALCVTFLAFQQVILYRGALLKNLHFY